MKNDGCQIWLLSLCINLVYILWWTIFLMTNKIMFRMFVYLFKRHNFMLDFTICLEFNKPLDEHNSIVTHKNIPTARQHSTFVNWQSCLATVWTWTASSLVGTRTRTRVSAEFFGLYSNLSSMGNINAIVLPTTTKIFI